MCEIRMRLQQASPIPTRSNITTCEATWRFDRRSQMHVPSSARVRACIREEGESIANSTMRHGFSAVHGDLAMARSRTPLKYGPCWQQASIIPKGFCRAMSTSPPSRPARLQADTSRPYWPSGASHFLLRSWLSQTRTTTMTHAFVDVLMAELIAP